MNYEEKGGLLYPVVKVEGMEKPLGKYGEMAMKYLIEEAPNRYDFLLATGELMKIFHEVDQEAMDKLDLLMEQILKEKPLTDPSNTILSWQEREQAKSIAEEIVLKEVVYKKR